MASASGTYKTTRRIAMAAERFAAMRTASSHVGSGTIIIATTDTTSNASAKSAVPNRLRLVVFSLTRSVVASVVAHALFFEEYAGPPVVYAPASWALRA